MAGGRGGRQQGYPDGARTGIGTGEGAGDGYRLGVGDGDGLGVALGLSQRYVSAIAISWRNKQIGTKSASCMAEMEKW
eukprot:5558804-Ditylum_brightwellii.AAC.1